MKFLFKTSNQKPHNSLSISSIQGKPFILPNDMIPLDSHKTLENVHLFLLQELVVQPGLGLEIIVGGLAPAEPQVIELLPQDERILRLA